MPQKRLALEIITARYRRPINTKLDEYLNTYGTRTESIHFLLNELTKLLDNPLQWTGYFLPESFKENTEFFKDISKKIVKNFKGESVYSRESVNEFFLKNHNIFKYATKRWLIVNAGICFELFTISEEKVQKDFLKEILKRGVKSGDVVLHLHIISNDEREDLADLGFPVPFKHWDKSYYVEALHLANEILQSDPSSIGLFCEDSWVFDPAIHEITSDGKPYASFSFLKDNSMIGERFFVGDALPDNTYCKQYDFALRSPRRLKLHQMGEFNPKTYGVFYSKEKLKENIMQSVNYRTEN